MAETASIGGNWIDTEDLNAWGDYDPLIDEPDDMPVKAIPSDPAPAPAATTVVEAVATVAEPVSTQATASSDASEKCELAVTPSTGAGMVTAEETKEIQLRMNRMRDWFNISSSVDPVNVIAREQAHARQIETKELLEQVQTLGAADPVDALTYVTGGQLGKLANWGSPIVQRYMQQFS